MEIITGPGGRKLYPEEKYFIGSVYVEELGDKAAWAKFYYGKDLEGWGLEGEEHLFLKECGKIPQATIGAIIKQIEKMGLVLKDKLFVSDWTEGGKALYKSCQEEDIGALGIKDEYARKKEDEVVKQWIIRSFEKKYKEKTEHIELYPEKYPEIQEAIAKLSKKGEAPPLFWAVAQACIIIGALPSVSTIDTA